MMSETEHKVGKLKPTGDTPQEYMGGVERPDYVSSEEDFLEWFRDYNYRKAVVINGLVYEVNAEEKDPCDDIFKAEKNEDGTISFEIKFYNGGCCFYEAIETALSKSGIKE